MKFLFLAASLLAVVFASAQADSLFRWVDKDGNVHYGDNAAEGAIGAEQKKFGAAPATGDDELSYGLRKAKQDFPVTLYSTENCGDICVQARSLLNKRGIPYVEKNLASKADAEAFKKLTGGDGVPALTVGKTTLSGFEAGQWNSELDIVGYPKIAPYGSRPASPAAAKPEAPSATDK
jgi:glutaredoxin